MENCVIVIGAGLAGLSAAITLQDAGERVIVLEKSDRAGGRVIKISHDGDSAEAGAQGIHASYTQMLKLIDRFDLSQDLIQQSTGRTAYVDRKGLLVYADGNLGILKHLGVKGSVDLSWFIIRYMLLMKKFSLYETHRDIPEYDNMSVAQAFSWASSNFHDYFLKPAVNAMTGSDLKHVNLYHFLNIMKLLISSGTSGVMTLKDGNESIAKKIADHLDVRYASCVDKLLFNNGRISGVRLEGGEILSAKHVVVTCPAGQTAKIMPKELISQHTFLSDFIGIPISLVYFFLDRRLDDDAFAYFGHAFRDSTYNMALNHTVKTPHLVPSKKSIISAWPCYPNSRCIESLTDQQIIDKAIGNMKIFFPNIESMINMVKIQKHGWGLGMINPGMHAKILKFKRQAELLKGVSFASNDYDGVHMESAIQSGIRAAKKIIK